MLNDDLIPVENNPGLFRDPATGAIINMDKSGAKRARNARERALQREQDIQDLKDEITELKDLVKQLIER